MSGGTFKNAVGPNEGQIKAFQEDGPNTPIYMVNLLNSKIRRYMKTAAIQTSLALRPTVSTVKRSQNILQKWAARLFSPDVSHT